MSPIEILDNLISRLNNLFTVQTQEVIPELNKIKELLEQKTQEKPVVIVAEKQISDEVVEQVKQEPTEEIIMEECPTPKETISERAMEYLKSIKAKGIYNYKSDDKLIERAIKE
jgi:predicted acyltransferase (DUF342 family)